LSGIGLATQEWGPKATKFKEGGSPGGQARRYGGPGKGGEKRGLFPGGVSGKGAWPETACISKRARPGRNA